MKKNFTAEIKENSKRLFCLIFFVVFFLNLTVSNFAQRNYLFENISIPEGLSNSIVNYLFQDSNGFLWISTTDGLNRYDGNSDGFPELLNHDNEMFGYRHAKNSFNETAEKELEKIISYLKN